jgi:hypothetical protein
MYMPMYLHAYVCMYMWVRVCMYVCIYMCIYVRTCIYVYIYTMYVHTMYYYYLNRRPVLVTYVSEHVPSHFTNTASTGLHPASCPANVSSTLTTQIISTSSSCGHSQSIIVFRFQTGARDSSLLHSVQIGSGAHTDSYSMRVGGHFP